MEKTVNSAAPRSSKAIVKLLSRVQLFATPWTVTCQSPSSMGFSRQRYWSGLPFPSLGDLPDPGIKPSSPTLQADPIWATRGSQDQTSLESPAHKVGPWLVPGNLDLRSFPGGSDSKESVCNAEELGLIPESERSPWRRKWQPTPVFLPGEFYGHRNLEGYSPWGQKESDMTKQLTLPLFPELIRVAHYT